MAWSLLVVAGLFEVVWAFAMKQSEGFTRLPATLIMLVAMAGSFGLLTLAMRNLPLGTAYMIWTGIGAVGTVIVGILVYKEPATAMRLFFIATLIGSIIGLKLATTTT